MATKAKSNGDGSLNIQAQGAGAVIATKKAKGKTPVEKPGKALREPLQHKKNLLERLGWTITEGADKKWTGEGFVGGEPWKITDDKISALLNSIIGIEEKDFISDLTSDESVTMLEWRVEGWAFEQDENLMWSATKGEEFAGKMSDLSALFSYIEGTETGDHKAAIEKMTEKKVAGEKKKYEDEGWRFIEKSGAEKPVWHAANPSPAFPAEIINESLPGIFDRIREIQKENSERLQKFTENNSTPEFNDVFTKEVFDASKNNEHFPLFAGKSVEEAQKIYSTKSPKNSYDRLAMGWYAAYKAALAIEENKILLARPERTVFRQGGTFTLKNGDERSLIHFHYHPGDHHLNFKDFDGPNAISATGYRSDVQTHQLHFDSFAEMIEKRVRYIAGEDDIINTKKQNQEKKKLSDSVEILDLKHERTELDYSEYFEAEKAKQKLADTVEWKLPVIMQFSIAEFIEKNEASALYLTDKGIVEIEYKDAALEKVSSIFINERGGEIAKREKTFGRTLMDTVISVEDFYSKFPMFVPKKTAAAFLKNLNGASGSEVLIDLELIVPSPFVSQEKRRARFTDEEIGELASSIEQDGLLSPIVVRLVGDSFEIVAGERRWLAARKLGKTQIAAFIKELSDQTAFRIQTVENLQRKQPEPLDEAITYKEYMDKFGLTVHDLSLEFGKREKFISERLKLNDLIPDALAAVESKLLPIGHAFEIAKHPVETQKLLLKKGVYYSQWVGNDHPHANKGYIQVVKPLADLKQFIRRDVFHNLETAPFSKSSEDLFPKNLACKDCPQRTHAKNLSSLFESDIVSSQDQCLNPTCFKKRLSAHIEQKVQEIAAEETRPATEVPYLTSCYASKYNGRDVLASYKYQVIQNKNKCASMQKGVYIDGNQVGLAVNLCQDKECVVHYRKGSEGQTVRNKTPEEKLADKRREDEELQNKFESHLRSVTRRQILFEISSRQNFEEEFFADNLLMSRLVAMVYEENRVYGHNLLGELVEKSGYELVEADDQTDEKPTGWEDSILKMDRQTRLQLLFLSLLNYNENIYYGESIEATKNLAARFTFDYKKIEAEMLQQISPPEFKAQAVNYLEKIKAGEDAVKPCFYFEKKYPDHPLDDDDEEDDDIDENDLGETSQG